MWAPMGVRKCDILHYREIKYEPVIPDAKRHLCGRWGKVGFRFHVFSSSAGRPFFLEAMLSGEFP